MHDIDNTINYQEMQDGEMDADEFDYEGMDEEYEEAENIDSEVPFGESEEMDLAAELLTMTGDEELEQFLGKLFKKIGRGFKKGFRPLMGMLKPLAKKLLPIAGTAVGTFFGGPAGGMVGSKIGNVAGKVFGMELEGLSPEDQEFEVARRFVRLAGTAARKASKAPGTANPNAIAKAALLSAVKKHAPGLLGWNPGRSQGQITRTGRWIRRGNKIILLGV